MDVCRAQAKFACPGFKDDAASVKLLELLGYLQGAIRGAVVHNDYFPVELAERATALACYVGKRLPQETWWEEAGITSR